MGCPCGSGLSYDDCCGLLHAGRAAARTAEALMRSRYAAYVVGDIDYLFRTYDPASVAASSRAAAAEWAGSAHWKRLDVVARQMGGANDETGTVEFIAWYEQSGRLMAHHERSRFRRVEGAWVYTDGEVQSGDGGLTQTGRNAPCPCGSGRKFKQCHGSR